VVDCFAMCIQRQSTTVSQLSLGPTLVCILDYRVVSTLCGNINPGYKNRVIVD